MRRGEVWTANLNPARGYFLLGDDRDDSRRSRMYGRFIHRSAR
jgi:hypothetical protein